MPTPVPWDWAKPRLMPLLAGPYLGPDNLVTDVAPVGCAISFGIQVGRAHVLVDDVVMERWECSLAQVASVAQANLDRRAGRLSPADVRRGVLAGHVVRRVDCVAWASSLILGPNHLVRLFGGGDQVLAVPRRDLLLSLPPDMPSTLAAHTVADFEADSAFPLLLEPFGLLDGQLVWGGASEEPEGDW